MRIELQKIKEDFKDIVKEQVGDLNFVVEGTSSVDHPKPNTLIFVQKEKYLKSIRETSPIAVVVESRFFENHRDQIKAKSILVLKTPLSIGLAQIAQAYFAKDLNRFDQGIHPKAVVHESAELDSDVSVGPGAVISQGCKIGRGSWIGANAFIGPNAKMGEFCQIYPNVFIGEDTVIGKRTTIQPNSTIGSDGYGYATDQNFKHTKIPQMGNVVIGDDVEIGANSTIDRAAFDSTVIKSGTKTDNAIHVAHNCEVGENCLLTGKFAVAGSSKIGDRCIFGGRVSVNDHIEITSDVVVGALSGVTRSLDKPGNYAGFPILPLSEFRRVSTTLAHLPQMRRDLSKLKSGRSE